MVGQAPRDTPICILDKEEEQQWQFKHCNPKSNVSFFRMPLWFSMIWLLILSRNVSSPSPSSSPSPNCSSDLDCSLNGLCVDRTFEFVGDKGGEKKSHQVRAPESSPTSKVCLCDKPWSGKHCEALRFLPLKGRSSPKNTNMDRSTETTAAMAIGSQGYGMVPNVTTWGGGILAEVISTTATLYHLYVARMTNDCPLQS
jgi:hypothetical protein